MIPTGLSLGVGAGFKEEADDFWRTTGHDGAPERPGAVCAARLDIGARLQEPAHGLGLLVLPGGM